MDFESGCKRLKEEGFLREEGTKGEKDSPSSSPSLGSPRALIRLKDKYLRRRLLKGTEGKSVSPVMILFYQRNDLGVSRYAVYSSRRLGGAVARNRVKRIFREILNRLRPRLSGYDFIMIPRQNKGTLKDVFPAVEKMLVEAGIVTK